MAVIGSATKFVFVNESIDSPVYKVGNRPDIRSHIRRHAIREFKQKYKVGRHDPKTRRRLSTLSSRSFNVDASNIQNYVAEDRPSPSNRSGRSVSDTDSLACRGDCVGNDIQNDKFDILEPPWEGKNDIFTIQVSGLMGTHGFYCNACGVKLHVRQRRKSSEVRIASRRQSWKSLMGLSLSHLLGAGRVDPFSSYPIEKPDSSIHELMDLCVTYLIPGLVPDDRPSQRTSSVNSEAKAWVSASLRTPFLFRALLFGASTYHDFIRSSQMYPSSLQTLAHKLIVIQKLNAVISDRRKPAQDEVILAILILASHEVVNIGEEKRKPFNSPLKTAQWRDIYGNRNAQYAPEHMKAILELIALKGGIENLELRGLTEVIELGDIIWALNSFSKPAHPQLRIHEVYLQSVKDWVKSTVHDQAGQTLASAFRKLPSECGLTDDMLQVFELMGYITTAIEHYISGKPAGLTLGEVARTRTAIQKQLLFLPSMAEAGIGSPYNIYEFCRLTALIFSIAVILPMPNTYDVLQGLVQRLEAALEGSGWEYNIEGCSEILLWILILGGVAALDKPERPWFLLQVVRMIERLELKTPWEDVQKPLEKFLWLDSACGANGPCLWEEAIALAM